MSKHKNRHLNESTGLLDANDEDGFMARSQLYFMARDAIKLHGLIGDRDELPPWLSAKITKAAEAIEACREYIEYHQATGVVEPEVPVEMPEEGMIEAVGDFAAPYYDLIDRVGGDAKLVNDEALAWMGGGQRKAMSNAHYDGTNPYVWDEYMSHDDIANTITRWLSGDEIKAFVDHFESHYDLQEEQIWEDYAADLVEAAGKYRVVGTTTSGEKFKSGVMDKKAADDKHYKMTKQTDKRGKRIYKKIEVVKEEQVAEQAEFDDGSNALNPQRIAQNMMKAARSQAMKKVKK